MTAAEQRYADALAEAIVVSLQLDPVPGDLVRVIVRWFEGPDYLTIHALGAEEENDVPSDDAWYPLEWPNEEREIDRVDAVMQDESLTRAIEELAAERDDESWPWDEQPAPLIDAVRKLRDLVESSGMSTAPHFAVGVSHFEGFGSELSVPRANPEPVLERLADRDLLPQE